MIGHAAHGNWIAVGLTSGGQCDIQYLTSAFGVVKEQLVKVAHTIKNNIVGVVGFDAQVLLHHWSVLCGGRFHRCLKLTFVHCYVAAAAPSMLDDYVNVKQPMAVATEGLFG